MPLVNTVLCIRLSCLSSGSGADGDREDSTQWAASGYRVQMPPVGGQGRGIQRGGNQPGTWFPPTPQRGWESWRRSRLPRPGAVGALSLPRPQGGAAAMPVTARARWAAGCGTRPRVDPSTVLGCCFRTPWLGWGTCLSCSPPPLVAVIPPGFPSLGGLRPGLRSRQGQPLCSLFQGL